MLNSDVHIRLAVKSDVETLATLIEESARELSRSYYTAEQTEAAIRTMFGVDSTLIADGTYFIAEIDGKIAGCGGWSKRAKLCGGDQRAGCGTAGAALQTNCCTNDATGKLTDDSAAKSASGCGDNSSVHPKANCSADSKAKASAESTTTIPARFNVGTDELLNPATDAAKIRAFFIAPEFARKGVGRSIFEACNNAAIKAGFSDLELMATLPGVPFYERLGFSHVEQTTDQTADGISLEFVRMHMTIRPKAI